MLHIPPTIDRWQRSRNNTIISAYALPFHSIRKAENVTSLAVCLYIKSAHDTHDHGPTQKINALFRIRSHLFFETNSFCLLAIYFFLNLDDWRLARTTKIHLF